MADGRLAVDLARYYDLDLEDDPGDLDLYAALAARGGGPILELAVGSGRLAVPLAAAGHDVVGVDNDPAMLARAARAWALAEGGGAAGAADGRRRRRRDTLGPGRRAGTLEAVTADVTDVRLARRFALVLLALNSLLLLPGEEAQAAALRTMAAHLAPGGLAVLDIFLPDADDLGLYDGRVVLDWTRPDPDSGRVVTKLSSGRHDAATATISLTTTFDSAPAAGGPLRRCQRLDELHLLTGRQLGQMAGACGLQVEVLAEDYQLNPFGPGAGRAVLLARSL